MDAESIVNFIRVNDRVGTGGQPTREQLEAVRNEGYQAVVNLAPSNPENNVLPDEEETVISLRMTYHHIPVQWTNPKREDFLAFSEVMETLRTKRVFIHCAANYRVTAFYSLYAMKHEGWTREQADQLISRIWESHPDYRMDHTWNKFIGGIRELDAEKQCPLES